MNQSTETSLELQQTLTPAIIDQQWREPDVRALVERLTQHVDSALSQMPITSEEQRLQASELLALVKKTHTEIEQRTKPVISWLFKLHRHAVSQVKRYTDQLQNLERRLKYAIVQYEVEQQRKREEQAEALRKQIEERRASLQKQIDLAMAEGDLQKAEQLLAELSNLVPAVPQTEPKLPKGESLVWIWEVEVVDPKALVDAIAAGQVPVEIITGWDLASMKRLAEAHNGLNWPGVRAERKPILRASRR